MIQTFEVANVRCGGCANTITKALQEAGFTGVNVDLTCEPRKVTVEAVDEAQLAHFKEILRKLGYPLSTEENGAGLKVKSFVSCAVGKFTTLNDAE
ncbi:MAG: heavy metal-associated domain-containing protein [Sulfuricurvum sp.]|uniref:heavy-metal-associated domain-containing protein n=1 Tax=Sulfuricurvum sp. TaxID=2025608 RepID=UPI00261E11D6|nr:heavy metal-associated domain-containing protein [Sulfuricurvum sp.]MDD2830125.1 heavy metal-associated domain-containing protein [Sulfuricurvum sp.]MDD4949611.1 heavy metal-associated domain-containing protein [Sulfuricurvum sp.]